MFANSVSPPRGGTSRASSIDAIGGSSRYAVSECQMPPKLIFSCSSFFTSIDLGEAGNAAHERYSIGLPMRRSERHELLGREPLVAKKTTRCSSHVRRISASSASPSRRRSMPVISAAERAGDAFYLHPSHAPVVRKCSCRTFGSSDRGLTPNFKAKMRGAASRLAHHEAGAGGRAPRTGRRASSRRTARDQQVLCAPRKKHPVRQLVVAFCRPLKPELKRCRPPCSSTGHR